MTIDEFGRTIKTKYPQYNDIPDAELGQKMITKYPQYSDMVTSPAPVSSEPSLGKKAADVTMAAGKVAADVTGATSAFNFGMQSGLAVNPQYYKELGALNTTQENRKKLAEYADNFIAMAGQEKDPTRKQKLMVMARDAIRQSESIGKDAAPVQQKYESINPTVGRITGNAIETATAGASSKVLAVKRGASYAAQVLPKVAAGAGIGLTSKVGSNLKNDKPITEGTVSATALGAAVPFATDSLARTAKHVSHVFSGTPTDLLEKAYDNPAVIGASVNRYKNNPNAESTLLKRAQNAYSAVDKARKDAYAKTLKTIEDSYRMTSLVPKAGTAVMQNNKIGGGGELFNLSKNGVYQSAANKLKALGVEVTTVAGGKLKFNNSVLSNADESTAKQMIKVINGWTDVTPTGLNRLAIKLGNFGTTQSKPLNTLAYGLKSNIRSYLEERVPEIKDLNADYAVASDFLDKIRSELGPAIAGKGSRSAVIAKLVNLFNRGSQERQDLVKMLGEKGGQDLINEINAATLAQWGPSGLTKRIVEGLGLSTAATVGLATGNPLITAGTVVGGAVASSPRASGKVSMGFGEARDMLQKGQNLGIRAFGMK